MASGLLGPALAYQVQSSTWILGVCLNTGYWLTCCHVLQPRLGQLCFWIKCWIWSYRLCGFGIVVAESTWSWKPLIQRNRGGLLFPFYIYIYIQRERDLYLYIYIHTRIVAVPNQLPAAPTPLP